MKAAMAFNRLTKRIDNQAGKQQQNIISKNKRSKDNIQPDLSITDFQEIYNLGKPENF